MSGKAVTSLVLGICSIPFCMLYGLPGLICGILAIYFEKPAKEEVFNGLRSPSSLGLAKAGKICGIVGLCLSLLYVGLIVLFFLAIIAASP